jgi:hypothetical protein
VVHSYLLKWALVTSENEFARQNWIVSIHASANISREIWKDRFCPGVSFSENDREFILDLHWINKKSYRWQIFVI